MKISDITVTYKNRDSLMKTLDSLISQRLYDGRDDSLEIIVVDGGSDDGSLELLEDYERRVQDNPHVSIKYISEQDSGIYNAMNKGVDMATGEWCMFINAGDVLYEENTIRSVISHIEKEVQDGDESYDIIYGDSARDYGSSIDIVKPSSLTSITKGLPFSHQAVLTRTELFKTRGYDESFCISGDYEWFLGAYMEQKSFRYIPVCISIFDTCGISSQRLYENYLEAERIRAKYSVADPWVVRMPKRAVWFLMDRMKMGSSFVEKLTGMIAKFR